jgi:hypothetical protein
MLIEVKVCFITILPDIYLCNCYIARMLRIYGALLQIDKSLFGMLCYYMKRCTISFSRLDVTLLRHSIKSQYSFPGAGIGVVWCGSLNAS